MKTFRIHDRLPFRFLRPLAQAHNYQGDFLWAFQERHLRTVATDEFRPPKQGEFYLSGAEIEAYRAPRDLSTPYRIARVVRVEEVKVQLVYNIDTQPEASDA